MTVIEGNKLIAEFMGFRVFHKRYPRNHGIGEPEAEWKDMIVEKAKYHSSWDWLMPVVEKIESLLFTSFTIEGRWSKCQPLNNINLRNRGETKIHSVWLTCTQFIQWYNSTLTNKTIK